VPVLAGGIVSLAKLSHRVPAMGAVLYSVLFCARRIAVLTLSQSNKTLLPQSRIDGIFPDLRHECKVRRLTGSRASNCLVSMKPGSLPATLVSVSLDMHTTYKTGIADFSRAKAAEACV
jgi:hypothetical protein